MKRIASLFLVLLLLLSVVSCGRDDRPVVMEYRGVRLTGDVYAYWLSKYKDRYLAAYGASDTDEFWSSVAADGRTHKEVAEETCDRFIMNRLILTYLFDHAGLSLTKSEREAVNTAADRLAEELCGGDRDAFDALCATFGVGEVGLKDALRMETKVARAYEALYAPGGAYTLSYAEREAYYEETYARVKIVLIRTKNKLLLDEDGNPIPSTDGTSYQTTGLTVAEREEKYETIERIRNALTVGEDFEHFLALSDDPATQTYANGFYFTAATDYPEDVKRAAIALGVGEWCVVESEYGTHFIRRYALDAGAFAVKENKDFFDGFDEAVYSYVFDRDMRASYADVTVYDEEKAKIDFSEVKRNWEF